MPLTDLKIRSLKPEAKPRRYTDGVNLFVDADACPVKEECYKVAERHGARLFVVSNSFLRVPRADHIEQIVVDAGPDEADNWIAERANAASVVVTADILLAERCLACGARVLQPNGKSFTREGIGAAVATHALMDQMRSTGDPMGGAAPFSAQNRSAFLQALHLAFEKLKRNSDNLKI
jgi:uncharacterized protein YaiI (UPF0178 family)